MMKKTICAAAVVMASTGAYAGPLSVDLFAPGTEQTVTDTTQGGVMVFAPEVGEFTSILGGYRDIGVNCIESILPGGVCGTGQEAQASVSSGAFIFSTDSNVIGEATIVWDGQNSDGLGGLDLTNGGVLENFLVETFFSDSGSSFGWSFIISATDTLGNFSDVELLATTVNGPPALESLIPFAAFNACGAVGPTFSVSCSDPVAGTDITSLDRLAVSFNTTGFGGQATAIDLTLLGVNAVPAPGALALLGIGLAGIGATTRMKRKKAA
jgi:hypothetical protein